MKFLSPVDVDGYISLITQDPGVTPTKFLIQDANGRIAFRTGQELKVDIGADYTSVLKHQVKASVAINKGQAVYAIPTQDGTNILVGLASNNAEATSSKTMGLLNATVVINGFADVITEGLLSGLNTIGATVGDPVWLGTNGNLIYGLANKPYAPNHLVFIGIVTRVNANNGEIFVKVQNGFELDELHDVDLKTTVPVNGHILGHNGTLWVNKTIAGWLGFTPADSARSISTTGPLQGGGDLSANRTLSISQATATTNGYLSSTDWNTFNNKQNALGYTPYNASNPAGYISSYTETDTLQTVTSRGATTSVRPSFDGGITINGQSYVTANGYFVSGVNGFRWNDSSGNYNNVIMRDNGTTWFRNYLETSDSMRASIFYDSNNTSYYLDPAGTSNISTTWITGNLYVTKLGHTFNIDGHAAGVNLHSTGNIAPHYQTDFAWYTGAIGSGTNRATLNSSGDFTANSSVRSPIFYDSNDTAFYVNPNSTSVLSKLKTVASQGDFTVGGSSGTYYPVVFYPSDTTDAWHQSIDIEIYRDDVHETGTAYGTFKFSLQAQPGDWGHRPMRIQGWKYLPGYGSPYNNPVGKVDVENFGSGIIVWLKGGATYHFKNNTPNAYAYLYFSNPSGTSWTGANSVVWNTITSQDYALSRGAGSFTNGLTTFTDTPQIYGDQPTLSFYSSNSGRSASIYLTPWDMRVGNASSGNLYLGGSNTVLVDSGAFQAPLMYDINNTGYYVDPASTSYLSTVNARSFITSGNPWGTGDSAWCPNGITTPNVTSWMYGTVYLGNAPGNGSGTEANASGQIISTGDHRASLFYDYNNTGYYLDPASTSNTNVVNTNGYSNANYGYRIFRNIGSLASWPEGYHQLTLVNSDAGYVTLNFHRSGYTSNNIYYDGAFHIDTWMDSNSSFRAPIFYDSNNTAFYMDPGGDSRTSNISVVRSGGSHDPYGALSVSAPSSDNYAYMGFTRNGVIGMAMGIDTSNNYWIGTSGGGHNAVRTGTYMTVSSGGTITATADVVAYSDRRVKENISTINDALNKVLSLRGVTYNRTDKEDKSEKIGVIAQEIQEILPQVVQEQEDGMLGVSYGNITAVLIEAVKEQQTQIEELKQLVNQLIQK